MKIFSGLTVALLIIFQSIGLAATETFSASGEYLMSDYDTPEIAEEIALDFAKQNAAEQAGIYLESYSLSIDAELEKDEIKTVASSKVEILEKNISRQPQADGRILLRADIKAKVDTSELDNFVKQTREQRQAAIQRYKSLQEMNAKIKQDIDDFQAKLAAIKDEVKDDDLSVEQERINREFLSLQKQKEYKFVEAIKINPRNCKAYSGRAAKTYSKSSPQEALKEFTRAMILEPKNPDNYNDRAYFRYTDLQDYEDAVADYDEALKLDPNNSSAVSGFYSIYHFKLKENRRGIGHMTEVIKLYPQNQRAYFYRGWLYQDEKDYAHAIEDYTRALELKADDKFPWTNRAECYRKLKDYAHAIEDYEHLTEVDLRYACNGLSSLYRFDTKDFARGIEHFTALIKRYPNKPAPYDGRSEIYKEMEDYPHAIEDLAKAASLEPKDSYYRKAEYKELADLCQEHGDLRDAVKAYDELISLEPKEAALYIRRGDLYRELKESDKAFDDYITAIKLEPTNESISRYIDMKDMSLPKFKRSDFYKSNDKDRIAKAFTELINGEPNNPTLYALRGDFYKETGDVENAVKDYMSAINLAPNILAYQKKIINLYKDAKDYDRAVKYYEQLVKLNPDNIYLLIELYKDMGETEKANKLLDPLIQRTPDDETLRKFRGTVDDYTHLIKLKPEDKTLYETRAALYAKNGDYDKAVADYTKAIEIDPRFMNCYDARAKVYVAKKDYAHAIEDYTWLTENDLSWKTQYSFKNRAKVYEQLGEYDKALADYDNSIEAMWKYGSWPKSAVTSFSDFRQVLDKLYQKGVVVEPQNFKTADAYQYCGDFYRDIGKRELIRHYKDPELAIKNSKRIFELAAKYYTRALEIDPNNKSAKENLQCVLDELKE